MFDLFEGLSTKVLLVVSVLICYVVGSNISINKKIQESSQVQQVGISAKLVDQLIKDVGELKQEVKALRNEVLHL